MAQIDPVSVIEAAYRLGGSDRAWMQEILKVVRPAWDDGMGVCMFELTLGESGRPSIGASAFDSDRPELLKQTVLRMNQQLGAQEIELTYVKQQIYSTLSERMAPVEADFRENAIYRELGHPHGIYDCVGLQIADPSGTMIMMAAPRREITNTSEAERQQWARLAAHIAAAHRLRRRHQVDGVELDDADAVLSADGRLIHVRDAALEHESASLGQLELAAEAIGRARGGMRHSAPSAALELWRVLVEGRYSLVHHVDTDGKEMLLVHRNEAAGEAPPMLSASERQVVHLAAMGHPDRLVAYELGLSLSSVERLLHSGLEKLGLESRVELFKAWDAIRRQTAPG